MIIVLDTNLWLKELALNSAIGSAFRFFLKRQGAKLAVPEVVRLEVQHNLRALVQGNIDDVNRGNRQLLALFGSMKEIVLPTTQEVDALVNGVFSSLGVSVQDVPFSFDSARAAFLKTIERTPPSDKAQEFKDGVLWADCVRLLEVDDVLFGTLDKAFYADRDYSLGLAQNLRLEVATKSHNLRITHSIAEVLNQVKMPIDIDEAWFWQVVVEKGHGGAERLLARNGVVVAGIPDVRRELFATENPDVLYFKYVITVPCEDTTGGGRTDVTCSFRGDGSLRPEARDIVDIRPGGETLAFVKADGTPGRTENVFLSGSVTIGHRTVTHSVRHPLDDPLSA